MKPHHYIDQAPVTQYRTAEAIPGISEAHLDQARSPAAIAPPANFQIRAAAVSWIEPRIAPEVP
ncbi:hypothetical protein GCM10027447_14740 [Glycomyces halotolerans]